MFSGETMNFGSIRARQGALYIKTALFAISLVWMMQSGAVAAGFGNPLAGELRITGTFGEPRSGHLHSGLDLSTGRAIGRPVLAVDDGYLARIKAGAYGYGRALYLETRSGHLAVYGHLSRFTPDVEDYLYQQQLERGEFEIDLYPGPHQFRFSKGDTIAYSGASGAGPAHLHFELRKNDRPVNPQKKGITPLDEVAPEIQAIQLRVLSGTGGAWRSGSWHTADQCLLLDPNNEKPIYVWGELGVEAAIIDRCGITNNRLTPFEIELTLNGTLLFSRRFDRLQFGYGEDVKRVYGRNDGDDRRWIYRLYRWPLGAKPALTDGLSGTGRLDFSALPPGRKQFRLTVRDANGNESITEFAVTAMKPPAPLTCSCEPAGDGRWRFSANFDQLPAQFTPWLKWRDSVSGIGDEAPMIPVRQNWYELIVSLPGRPQFALFGAPMEQLTPWMQADVEVLDIGLNEAGAPCRIENAEGLLLVEIPSQPLRPGMPAVFLVADDERFYRCRYRGITESKNWQYAISLDDLPAAGNVRSRSMRQLRLEYPCDGAVTMAAIPPLYCLSVIDPPAGDQFRRWSIESDTARFSLECQTAALGTPLVISAEWIATAEADGVVHQPIDSGDSADLTDAERLRLVSPVIHLKPDWWPLSDPLKLSMSVNDTGDDSPRTGLYSCDNDDGEWNWVGKHEFTHGIGGEQNGLGYFALLTDNQAPRLRDCQPADLASIQVAPIRLQVRVIEGGSGFTPEQADIFLDGEMLLAEWDMDEKILSASIRNQLSPGSHRWQVRIVDRAGNIRDVEYQFNVGGK
jgi:hypothetical protein